MYSYINKEPFVRKVTYDFANVSDAYFWQDWQNSRSVFNQAHLDIVAQDLDETDLAGGSGNIVSILRDHNYLDRLVHKFEVFGRLFDDYDENFRKTVHANPCGTEHYILFARKLVAAALQYESLQYLSTLLKLNDCFLGLDFATMDNKFIAQIKAILRDEDQLIRDLKRRI